MTVGNKKPPTTIHNFGARPFAVASIVGLVKLLNPSFSLDFYCHAAEKN
jgi:hypothetical protein